MFDKLCETDVNTMGYYIIYCTLLYLYRLVSDHVRSQGIFLKAAT